jgi:hypothetical protein
MPRRVCFASAQPFALKLCQCQPIYELLHTAECAKNAHFIDDEFLAKPKIKSLFSVEIDYY